MSSVVARHTHNVIPLLRRYLPIVAWLPRYRRLAAGVDVYRLRFAQNSNNPRRPYLIPISTGVVIQRREPSVYCRKDQQIPSLP
jgi:hypothetical protein